MGRVSLVFVWWVRERRKLRMIFRIIGWVVMLFRKKEFGRSSYLVVGIGMINSVWIC